MTTPPDIQIPTTVVTDDNSFSPAFLRRLLTKFSAIIAIDQEQDPATWAEEWHMLQQLFWALKPTNPVEAVLAARVVDANHRGMEISKRAAQPDLSDEKFHRLHTSANAAARALSAALTRLEKRRSAVPPPNRSRYRSPCSSPLFPPQPHHRSTASPTTEPPAAPPPPSPASPHGSVITGDDLVHPLRSDLQGYAVK